MEAGVFEVVGCFLVFGGFFFCFLVFFKEL